MTAPTPAVLTAENIKDLRAAMTTISAGIVGRDDQRADDARKILGTVELALSTIDAQAAEIERLRGRIETLNWLCDFNNDAIAILTGQRDRARAALAPAGEATP